jgi:predicted AAA+ superfamily ATPase
MGLRMFSRKILNDLEIWADQNRPKPLILRGARQVGKTTAVELFADRFEKFVCLNLEKEEDGAHFKPQLPVKELLQSICLAKNVRVKPGRTLLFLDEIQEVPEAVTMLRYFYEELADQLHVIAAGSLLETMLGA